MAGIYFDISRVYKKTSKSFTDKGLEDYPLLNNGYAAPPAAEAKAMN